MMSEQPIIVVTTGRCGSSYIAGALDKLGVRMGDSLVPGNKNNPAGHWEDQEFKRLNLAYLDKNLSFDKSTANIPDLTLSDFRQRAEELSEKRDNQIIRVAENVKNFRTWGFKVPSTAEVLEHYLDIIDAKVIWCQRSVNKVKESMRKAYGWNENIAENLIESRLNGIEKAIERKGPPLLQVEYEDIFDNTEQILEKLIDFCEIEPSEEQKQKALDLKVDEIEGKPEVWVSVLNQGSLRPGLSNILTQMTHDQRVKLHIDYPNQKPEVRNRNQIVKNFMKSGHDSLIMIDNDVVPRSNPLDLVFLNKDIVNFAAPQWRKDPEKGTDAFWVAMNEKEDGWQQVSVPKRRSLQQVDATGQACIIIKREVFEKMEQPYFAFKWNKDGEMSEGMEYRFCREAKKLGFKTWVHFDYFASHYKKLDVLEVLKLLGRKNV